MMGMWLVYRCLTGGGGDGLRCLVLCGHRSSCTRSRLYLRSMKWIVCVTLFLHLSTPWHVSVSELPFLQKRQKKNELDKLPQTPSRWDLHTIMRVISRGVPGLANDFHFWCLGSWMNNLPPVSCSTYRFKFFYVSHLKVSYGGVDFFCWFLGLIHVLYITRVLSIISSRIDSFSTDPIISSTLHWYFSRRSLYFF